MHKRANVVVLRVTKSAQLLAVAFAVGVVRGLRMGRMCQNPPPHSDCRFKCWVVTHRAAFMGTVAGLGVIGVSSGVVRMVYR